MVVNNSLVWLLLWISFFFNLFLIHSIWLFGIMQHDYSIVALWFVGILNSSEKSISSKDCVPYLCSVFLTKKLKQLKLRRMAVQQINVSSSSPESAADKVNSNLHTSSKRSCRCIGIKKFQWKFSHEADMFLQRSDNAYDILFLFLIKPKKDFLRGFSLLKKTKPQWTGRLDDN